MNALAVAVQGLGFDAAYVALQGLLAYVGEEVVKYEQIYGQGLRTRRNVKRVVEPLWLPKIAVEDDEALLLIRAI